MRKTLAISVAAVGVGGVIAAAIAWPRVERRVLETVRQEIRGAVEADVDWQEANLAFVRPFPSVGIQIDGLTITGRDAFAGVELARVERVSAAVDLRSVFGSGPMSIRSVNVEDAQLHAIVDAEGRANYDVLADTGEGGATELRLDRIVAEDLDILYEDRGSGLVVDARDVDHQSSGDVGAEAIRLDSRTTIGALTVGGGGDPWLADTRWDADLDLSYDRSSGRVEVPEGRVAVNELPIDLRGAAWPVDGGYGVDVEYRAADDAFGPLLSLIPDEYAGSIEDLQASGTLGLEGAIRGEWLADQDHWPALTADLDVKDGSFQRAGGPAVEDIAGAVRVAHPEGPLAATTIEAPALTFSAGGHTLRGALHVSDPFGDPRVRGSAEGAVDLGTVDQALPEDDTTIAGIADVDLEVSGLWSDIGAQRADQLDLSGTIRARDARYEGPAVAVPLQIDTMALTLGPRTSRLDELRVRYDGSDLAASGTLDNLPGYALGEGVLGGVIDVKSERLDVTKLLGEPEAGSEADAPAIAQVPADLGLTVRADVGEAVWKGIVFDDVSGAVALGGGEARLDDVEAGLKGGRIGVSGTYAARSPDAADVDLDVRLAGFEVGEALETFPSLGAMVPYLASAQGQFDATMALDTQLGPDGSPLWSTFDSKGAVVTRDIVAEPMFLGAVANQLSNARFQRLGLDDTTIRFDARDGRLHVPAFPAEIGGAEATLGGTIGILDRTLDLDITLAPPAGWVEGSPLAALAAPGEPLSVTVDVKGSWDDPRVGVDAERAVRDVVDSQVDRVRDEVEKGLDEEVRSGLRRIEDQLKGVLPAP